MRKILAPASSFADSLLVWGEGLVFFSHKIPFTIHLFSESLIMPPPPRLRLQHFAADLTATDSGALLARLQRLLAGRGHKLPPGIHRGQPEAVLVGEVVARAFGAIALDERSGAEILQAGAGRHQGLTAAFRASRRVLQ